MRVGGYNNDANTQDPFDDAAFDNAVAYARAIGAEPIIQVPLLADTSGKPPTAATAAGMVTYANVTKGYGLKYFSIGNEPDLYASQGLVADPTQPAIPGYTPADYCATATAYVAAMKAVDPTIKIVGPDLSWKYMRAGNDWLTPILTSCGDLFDIVSIHRYPFEAAQATLAAAAADAASFRTLIASVRGILQATGQGAQAARDHRDERRLRRDLLRARRVAGDGRVGALARRWPGHGDRSRALDLGRLGYQRRRRLVAGPASVPRPAHMPRPEYYAYALYAEHFGPTLLTISSAPAGVSAHASRNAADDATEIIVVNWNESARAAGVLGHGPRQRAGARHVRPAAGLDGRRGDPRSRRRRRLVVRRGAGARRRGPRSLSAGSTAPIAAGATDAGSAGDGGAGKVLGNSLRQRPGLRLPEGRAPEPRDHHGGRQQRRRR